MRILLTGSSRLHANNVDHMKTRYQSTPAAVYAALTEAGHNVDFRAVRPGETLDYDCMILGVSPIDASPAKHSYGMLWAAAHNTPKCFLVDDWQAGLARQPFAGNETSLFRAALGRLYRDDAERVKSILFAVARYFNLPQSKTKDRWKVPTIGTFFDHGDLNKFKRFNAIGELRSFMPSPFIPDYAVANQDERDRMWVSATLGNQEAWVGSIGLSWPVDRYGYGSAPSMDEKDIVVIYGSRWGVLCPRYRHAGSGWWRCRYEYSARARCILLGAPDEVSFLGPAYTRVAQNPAWVETLGDENLRELADEQVTALQPHLWSKDRLVTWMDRWVNELVRRGASDTPVNQIELRAARFDPATEVEDIWE